MAFIEALSKGNQISDLRRALHCRCVRDDSAGIDLSQIGVTSRNGKNRTLSPQQRPASAVNRGPCEVSAPTLTIPLGVRVFPVPPG